MFNKFDGKALILGFFAKFALENALDAVLFFIFGTYMRIVIGASPWWLYERFHRSPIGIICGTFTALASYWLLGFVIGRVAKHAPLFNVGAYLVIEALLSLIALGLDLPKYARVDFWESFIGILCIVAAFIGTLSVNQIVKHHANT
jgi:hypothetical protein